MIEYDIVDSSFFRANKEYIEYIQKELNVLGIICLGYCSGFGYDVEAEFEKSGLKFKLKFIKYQTTQTTTAHEYTGTVICVTGINLRYKLKVSKSLFQRCFCSSKNKLKISKPYYLKYSDTVNDNIADSLAKILTNNEISKILIKNEKCEVVIHKAVNNPIELVNDVEYIIKRL